MSRALLSGREHVPQGRAGRDEGFAEFMAARQTSLLRTAYLLTGDETSARELVTTSLGRLYPSWGEVRSGEGPDAFMRRVMFRAHSSRWRLLRRRASQPRAAPTGGGSALWRSIRSLPAKQRALVVLCHFEGLSEMEAAVVLGISASRAGSLLAKARATLGHPAAA